MKGGWALVLILASGVLLYRLDGYALLEPDEGRNAEVAREMAAGNDYVLPRLDGLPYVDKPVLYFAAGALAIEVLGPTETAARLPSVVFTLLTLALVAGFARKLYGPDGVWIAGVSFIASPFTLAYARTVIMDSAVSLWMTAAIAAFYLSVETTVQPPARSAAMRWAVAGWIAIGLGVLTKGPIALAVPLLVMAPYALWRRRLSAMLEPLGLLAFLAVVLPWIFAVSARVPDFLHYVLVVETGGRLTGGGLGRAEAWWYFVPILAGAAFPWSVVALAGIRRRARGTPADPRVVLLLCWIVVPLLFFTLSQSKRPQYVLPLVPAFALAVTHRWTGGPRVPAARIAGVALALLGVGLLAAAGQLGQVFPAGDEVAALIPRTARWLGVAALVGGALSVIRARCRYASLGGLALPVLALPVVGLPLLVAIGRDRSSADLATAMRPYLSERTEVVAAGAFPLSLPFYLRRTLTLSTRDGRELTSNYVLRRHDALRLMPGSPLRPASWWLEALALCDRPRLFIVPVDARAARDRLATVLPLIAMSRKVAVYGPCGGDALARWFPLSRKGEGAGG